MSNMCWHAYENSLLGKTRLKETEKNKKLCGQSEPGCYSITFCYFETSPNFHLSIHLFSSEHTIIHLSMPARFHRIIYQQAQVSSFETICSDSESLTIVLLSKYIKYKPSSPWYSPNCSWKMFSLSDLVLRSYLKAALAQRCPLRTNSLMTLHRRMHRPCMNPLLSI